MALSLIGLELLLNLVIVGCEQFFGLCERHPYRLNWFVLGLTAALAQGSLILLLLILVLGVRYCLIGPPSLMGRGAEITVKSILAAAGICAGSLEGLGSDRKSCRSSSS